MRSKTLSGQAAIYHTMQPNRSLVCGFLALTALGSLSLKAALTPDEGSGLFVTGTLGEQYNDNLFLRTHNAKSDYITTLTPGLEYDFGANSQTQGMVSYQEAFARYDSDSNQNSNLGDATMNLTYNNDRTKGSLNASFVQLDSNDVGLRNDNIFIRRDVTMASGNGEWGMSEKTSFAIGGNYTHTEYKQAGFPNSSIYALPIDVYYKMTPDVDMSLDYQFRESDITGLQSYQDNYLGVGARGQFTEKFSGLFSVGATERSWQHSGGTQWMPGGHATFTYLVTPKTTFQFGGSEDFNSAAAGTSQKSLSGWAGVQTNFEGDFSASAKVTYEHLSYLTGIHDEYWKAELGLQYQLNKYVSFKAGYTYMNDSTDYNSDFTDNVFSISGTVRF
jgi:hypothetical protein